MGKGRRRAERDGARAKKDKVWVCRGCCCGTKKKHPGVDHVGLERQLRAGAQAAGARYEVTGCLGPCGQGNVVVVRSEGRLRWFRKVNSTDVADAVLSVLTDDDPPAALDGHRLRKHDGKKPDPD